MRAVIAGDSAVLRDHWRQVVLGCGLECGADDCVTLAQLPSRLAETPPGLVLLAVPPGRSVEELVRQVVGLTAAPVLVLGPGRNSQQVFQALRGGAQGYLDQTRLGEDLLAAVRLLQHEGAAPRWGKALGVTAAAPGSGVTTVAANLAFALADTHPDKVVLAEVSDGVPGLAVDLDLQPRHTVADLVAVGDRLDATMLRNVLVAHPARLSILADRPDTLNGGQLTPAGVQRLLVLLRSMFGYTVLDLGHAADATRLAAMALTDEIVVVMRLDVPSLRLTRQFLRQLAESGIPAERVRLLANRQGQRRQLDRRQAEEALGQRIQEWVPDDPAAVNEALNQGQPLLQTARRAPITRAFAELAYRLNGRTN